MFINEDKEEIKKKILSAYCFAKPDSKFAQVIDAVGTNTEDVSFWHAVCDAYVGLGWNPKNVKVMLEFYDRREIPSSNPGQSKSGPTSLETIHRWVEKEGVA